MKRLSVILAVSLIVAVVLAARADAADTLRASASCNSKWVVVTVDVPDTAVIVATYNGKSVGTGNRFVVDTGGGLPADQYDIDIALEQRDTTAIDGHRVLASTSVRTPNCATVSVPVNTVSATVLAPAVVVTTRPRQIVEPSLSWIPVLPEWLLRAVVEAVRGLP